MTELAEVIGAVAGVTAPWADLGLVVADTSRFGPTVATVQLAGDVEHHAVTFDPESGRIQLSLFDSFGQRRESPNSMRTKSSSRQPMKRGRCPLPTAT